MDSEPTAPEPTAPQSLTPPVVEAGAAGADEATRAPSTEALARLEAELAALEAELAALEAADGSDA